jgi:polysaccharide export outer membrane protein
MLPVYVRRICTYLTLFASIVGNCAAQTAPTGHFAVRDPRYRIATSDVIELTFAYTPELNQVATVQPDGFLSLRSAGDVKVQGLTVPEVTTAIKNAYATMLHEPVITVSLKEFVKPAFVIAGEIAKPGKYELRGSVSLTDAIAIAGGMTKNSKSSAVLLFRRVSPDTVEVKKFNVDALLGKGKLAEDPELRAGDSIYASESLVGKIDRFLAVTRLGFYFPIPAIP